MKRLHFFATKEDLLPVLDQIDGKGKLSYVLCGNFRGRRLERYSRGIDIPQLGEATTDNVVGSARYLVCKAEETVQLRTIRLNSGGFRFVVDQLVNPNTVVFTPAGIWGQDFILHGEVATVSDSPSAQDIMRWFGSAIRKQFVKIRAFNVGPRANALRESGRRLTSAAQCPPEYDLKP
jgi:hypothetical protein